MDKKYKLNQEELTKVNGGGQDGCGFITCPDCGATVPLSLVQILGNIKYVFCPNCNEQIPLQ